MGSEHYCLRWNNHQSNLLGVFSQLLQDESLVDVTLACAEGHSIRAHKVVLSACSSYFQTLFVDHPNRHPIVILKDVRFAELRTLVEFMYKGEVNVEYCQLSALLKTAESLKVKGLAEMTNLNATRDDRSEMQKHGNGSQAENSVGTDLVMKREINEETTNRSSPHNEDGCDGDDSCDEGAERSRDRNDSRAHSPPECEDLSPSGQSRPSDMSIANNSNTRLPSPHSNEPLPGPSGLPPVQQVPLSLKKEIDWDRNIADDKSTTGESSSDYRHSHDADSVLIEGRFGILSSTRNIGIEPAHAASNPSSRCSTPFQFPFHPVTGFPDMLLDLPRSSPSALFSLLQKQSMLTSSLSSEESLSRCSSVFRCSICLAAFPSAWLLEQHCSLQHSIQSPHEEGDNMDEKPFKCDQCGQSYRYRSAYLKHREQNHRARLPADKLFTCDVCGMQFRYLKSFKKHRLNHALEKLHSKAPTDIDAFSKVIKANGNISNLFASGGHPSPLKSSSLPESSSDCKARSATPDRDSATLSPSSAKESKDEIKETIPATNNFPSTENGNDQVSSSNEVTGDDVGESCPTTSTVERSSAADLKAKQQNFYKFSLDDYYYGGKTNATNKKGIKSDGMCDGEQDETIDSLAFALSVASKASAATPEASLMSFLQVDSDRQRERRFACPFCGKCVRSKENLKLHVRKHTGERPFVCLFCGRAFGGKSDLTRHLRIHTGERPYHCEMCGKCFARADYLSKHLTTHIHNSQR